MNPDEQHSHDSHSDDSHAHHGHGAGGESVSAMDPTFYRSPAAAVAAPREKLAYVVAFDHDAARPDALTVVDLDPDSDSYGTVVGWEDMPSTGDELHHFGWNACSSSLMHEGHDMTGLSRRYLLMPGLRSSNVHIADTHPDPRNPRVVKTITAEELAEKAGYSRPHTLHCGPDGVYLSCLGAAEGDGGPGGIAVLDHNTFDVVGRWETDRGPQHLAYDAWWHLMHNTLVTSEWGTPAMVENGIVAEQLLNQEYGHALHFWDLAEGKHLQRVELGPEHQMALELRPAHDPEATWGLVDSVISTEDLSASIFHWHRTEDRVWSAQKVISIPAEPLEAEKLPEFLQPFGVVPPLVTDISLSVDDRWLYVSCWGTGELKQYDVSDPAHPRETGSVRLGGIGDRAAHPSAPGTWLGGGPQMVETSRDGKRVYVTNSLYGAWDDQLYPNGIGAWMAKIDADTDTGGLSIDEDFFLDQEDFRGLRVHQIRLQGGDASSDSYCYRT